MDFVESIKHLGLTIQCDLTWSNHIRNICSKARRLVGLLFCQFYHYAEPATIKILYLTLIRPNLKYASIVWDPYLVKNHKVLEDVQKFACRVCTKDWHTDYQYLLDGLHIPSLKLRTGITYQHPLYHVNILLVLSIIIIQVYVLVIILPYFLVIRRISLISAYSLLSACYFVGLSTRY